MLKVTKTKITVNEFIKEVEALFPGKFTEGGLRVLFEYLEDYEDNRGITGECELYKIGDNFEEWTFEKYQDYLIKRYAKVTNKDNYSISIKEQLWRFLQEEVWEDEWSDSVVGITDSTIMFTTYYTSKIENELKKLYERLRTLSIKEFCKEFDCSSVSECIMQVFKPDMFRSGNYLVQLVFRGMTDTEITFEQYLLPNPLK